MSAAWRGAAAIVGVAESDLGRVPEGLSSLDLIGQATAGALAEAGLGTEDVDALYTTSAYFPMSALVTAEYLGVRPRVADGTNIGGSTFVAQAVRAAQAIAAGEVEVALICYSSTQLSDGGRLVTTNRPLSYEGEFSPRFPISMFALATARHMHEFGTTREQLAEVAVAARRWAQLNPKAYARDELSVEDVLGSRMVSDPLTVRDCCLVTDGGGAVVMTSAERARDLPQEPVYVLGGGEATDHANLSQMPDLTTTAAAVSGARAWETSGLGPADMDVVQLYDAFTINPVLFLEDLGFCAKGEGGAFVADGGIAPGGRLPVNTSGGGLSYCHPGMFGIFLLIEATRQLRGETGARQVAGARTALVHGNGGALASEVTAVLGTADTL
ncbi:thiolase [Marmoricola endophyticus]|uniref:Thiolase n=1 Tax=Marmoricola endophyticus TaxID=2040280 RepID=A0A917BJW1_9ACTN|nr:acetyl-CoA acetyltransferase [Marmoricola endophyticus]GGF48214.1 thiolase [Marmoricola endophyticus]